MSKVVPLKQPSAKTRATKKRKKAAGKTLCKSGFHKWRADDAKQFDVKRGKLVSIMTCTRCGEQKTTLS